MRADKLTPLGWFLLLLLLGGALHLMLPWHFSAYTDLFYARFFGIKALCVSGLINVVALRAFTKHGTPYAPDAKPAMLLEKGIFAISRNPVYLALVLAMVGLSGVLDAIWLLAAAAVLWLALDRRVIPREEATLLDTFGPDYETYRGVTRRWL